MRDRRRLRPHPIASDPHFPEVLAEWISTHEELLDALSALRRLGDCGREAVEAISRDREVAKVRESWALWEVLSEGDGDDPEVQLLRAIRPSTLEWARRAIWGPRWDLEGMGDLIELGGVRRR